MSKSNSKKPKPPKNIVELPDAGLRLDQWCSRHFDALTIPQARKQIGLGNVWLNGRVTRQFTKKLRKGDLVHWGKNGEPPPKERTPSGALDWPLVGGMPSLLFRDRHLAIVDKPSGIPVEPTPKNADSVCLRQVEMLLVHEGIHPSKRYVAAAHRLDAGASGVVAFATSKSAASSLGKQFQQRLAKRVYEVLVVGRVKEDQCTLRHHMAHVGPGLKRGVVSSSKGKSAITHCKVIERFDDATHLEVTIETGRTHQIRVHLAHIGHPLVGDWLYCSDDAARRVPSSNRMFLHARTLTLTHPATQELVVFSSDLPEEMVTYMRKL